MKKLELRKTYKDRNGLEMETIVDNPYQLIQEKINEIIEHLNQRDNDIIKDIQPVYRGGTFTNQSGEWCQACGAWKQYGLPDNHHCTGYKVIC